MPIPITPIIPIIPSAAYTRRCRLLAAHGLRSCLSARTQPWLTATGAPSQTSTIPYHTRDRIQQITNCQQITNGDIAPLCQNGAETLVLRCGYHDTQQHPAPLGAGWKTRLESSIYKSSTRFIHDCTFRLHLLPIHKGRHSGAPRAIVYGHCLVHFA